MSFDLNFWRYQKEVYLNNHDVYTKCSEGGRVNGLEDLPIDKIREEVANEFAEWETEGSDSDWKKPDGRGAFQLFCTTQFIRFDCYGMSGNDMNRLIDIMLLFDCPLYDPQAQERFDRE